MAKAGDERRELIGGCNPVAELLAADASRMQALLYVRDRKGPGRRVAELLAEARRRGVPVKPIPAATLDRLLPGVRHQGVAAEVVSFAYTPFQELLALLVRRPGCRLLALDGITDPRNLGAIIRSAAAAGVDGLLLPERRCAPLNALAGKTAAGALERLPVSRVGNLVGTLAELKKAGFWIYGAAAAGGTDLYEAKWSERLVLVLGAEDRGLRPLVARQCDFTVTIPLARGNESLNVGIAAAVILFEQNRVLRQTRNSFASRSVPGRERDSAP